MSGLNEKVKSSVSELASPGDHILMAVSGGIDSMAMLYLLKGLSKEFGYELSVAHLNHLARGAESDEDAKFVANVAKELSLPCYVKRINVSREASHLKTSFQESARIIRYQFLETVLSSIDGNKIAVGHNADDQAETVLMNLLRGAGLRGLAGIPPKRGTVIRPLLNCTRSELKLFLDNLHLTYREDSSNKQKKYLRNKIRLDLIPVLKTFNAGISGNLAGLAEIVRDEDDWVSEQSRVLFSRVFSNVNGELNIKQSDFYNQPQAMKRRLIREAFLQLRGGLRAITAKHVQQVLDLFAHAKVGSWLKLPGNVKVSCGYESVSFSLCDNSVGNQVDSPNMKTRVIRLKIPGITGINEIGLELHTRLVESPVPFTGLEDEKCAYLDFEKTGESLRVRFFQHGDHFVPLGMKGRKKLKSYFIDRKIPREQRYLIPLLTNAEDDIIWIYGERISDRFRTTDKTRKVLFIQGKEA